MDEVTKVAKVIEGNVAAHNSYSAALLIHASGYAAVVILKTLHL